MLEPKVTIKVSLKQIFEGQRTLQKILNTQVDVKIAYRLNKIADVLFRSFKAIEKERIALVDQFGKDDGEGSVNVPAEKIKEFNLAFEKSLEKEIDLEAQPIPFSCLKAMLISAADLVAIKPFVSEPTDEDLQEPKCLVERKLA